MCHVDGAFAAPLLPTRGIPAGDPVGMRILGLVLASWPGIIERHDSRPKTWGYADDRSIAAKADAQTAKQLMNEVFEITREFCDDPIGVRENAKKRQVWTGDEDVEHLRFRVQLSTASTTENI